MCVTVVYQNVFLNAVLKIQRWNVLIHVRMTRASTSHACHMLVRVWTVWYVMDHVVLFGLMHACVQAHLYVEMEFGHGRTAWVYAQHEHILFLTHYIQRSETSCNTQYLILFTHYINNKLNAPGFTTFHMQKEHALSRRWR